LSSWIKKISSTNSSFANYIRDTTLDDVTLIPIVGTNQNPKNLPTTKAQKTKFPVGAWEIERAIKKNDYINHMDSGIFDEPGCMGKRRGRV
jgi:hypothetical protein